MLPCTVATTLSTSAIQPVTPTPEESSKTQILPGETGMSVKVSPNPSNTTFTFFVSTPKKIPVHVRLIDEAGRLVEGLNNAPVGTQFKMGEKIISGIYFAEVIQGKERVILKLIKQGR
jgi:hypothetical protein